jgi:hypothetical protein
LSVEAEYCHGIDALPVLLSRRQLEDMDVPEGQLSVDLRLDAPLGELSNETLLAAVTPSGVNVRVELDTELGVHFILAHSGGRCRDMGVDVSSLGAPISSVSCAAGPQGDDGVKQNHLALPLFYPRSVGSAGLALSHSRGSRTGARPFLLMSGCGTFASLKGTTCDGHSATRPGTSCAP